MTKIYRMDLTEEECLFLSFGLALINQLLSGKSIEVGNIINSLISTLRKGKLTQEQFDKLTPRFKEFLDIKLKELEEEKENG